MKPRDAERSKNFFALGLICWMYTRPVRADPRLDRGEVREERRWSPRPTARPSRPVTPSARPPSCSSTRTRCVRPTHAARHLHQHHRATPRWRGAWSPPAQLAEAAGVPRQLSDHAGLRHPPRAVEAQELRRPHAAGRGRDRRHRCGPRRRVRRAPRGHHHRGPGHRAQGRDHRAWPSASSCRWSSSTSSAAARRPGCRPRPSRPTCCMAMYGRHGESPLPDRGGLQPVALLRRGHRGGADRAQVPHAGDAAVRRLPRQRHRAVAAPRRADAARHLRRVRHRAQPRRRDGEPEFWPYLRDPETLARPWAIPGTPGLEHRIGGIEKEDGTGNISYDPDNHEHMVHLRADKVAGIADDIPPVEVDGDVDDADLLVLGWGSTWGAIDGAANRCRARGRKVAHAHLVAPQPVPGQPRRGAAPLPEGAGARDEPRSALPAAAGRVPRRRPIGHQGAGRAVHRRRARSRPS